MTAASIPPWTIKQTKVLLELHNLSPPQKKPHPLTFQDILANFPNYTPIYTNWSKCEDKIGCAAVSQNITKKRCLTKESSIFTVESYPIELALNIISESKQKNFLTPLSVLLALKEKNPTTHL